MPANQTAGRKYSDDRKKHEVFVYDGNVIRRVNPVPEEQPEGSPLRKQPSVHVRRNRERARLFNAPACLFLTAATLAVVFVCASYLQVQSSIISHKRAIKTLETTVTAQKANNDAREDQLATYVDLDYIYNVATQQLGMVYASSDQIITYSKTESEYVRQYENIPTGD